MARGFLGEFFKVNREQAQSTPQQLINNAPELPDVAEAIAQTRQLVLRSFSPKPFGGALATTPFGIAAPAPGSIGQKRTLTGS